MKAIYKIPTDLCIMEIPGQSSRPTFEIEEDVPYINAPYIHKPFKWLPIEINFDELTSEQRGRFQHMCDLRYSKMGRSGYGGPMKFSIQIDTEKEVWTIEGCYVDKVEGNTVTLTFDRAILHT